MIFLNDDKLGGTIMKKDFKRQMRKAEDKGRFLSWIID
jgi:hypothetical protein